MKRLNGKGLTLEDVVQVAREREPVSIDPDSWSDLLAARELVFELAGRGIPIYGCNTGVGWNKDQKVTPDFIEAFNHNVIYSHAVGVRPYAPVEVVRAVMLVRLNCLLSNCTGITPAIAQRLAEFLNRGIHPVLPMRGSIGQADIGPLSHIALAITGGGEAEYHGEIQPVARILKQERLEPVVPREKDGLAMMSSNALSAGHGALVLWDLGRLLRTADLIACLSLEGLNGNTSQIQPASYRKRGYANQERTAREMNRYLKGSSLYQPDPEKPLQDPLCFRNIAQLHGSVKDAWDFAVQELTIQINSSDDNPCMILEDRDIMPTANFEPLAWVLPMEMLAIGLSHLSRASCLRTVKFADPRFTGLPRNLSPSASVIAFSTIQKTYTSLDAEIRHLSNPSSVDSIPLAGGIEDRSTNAPLVVDRLERILDDLCYILGIELIHGTQAMDLRPGRQWGQVTGQLHDLFRERVSFYDSDNRLISEDIEAAYQLIKSGELWERLELPEE